MNNSEILTVQSQIHSYFTALYGESYTYRAPETFDNALERWMLMVASGDLDAAASQMAEIEQLVRRSRG